VQIFCTDLHLYDSFNEIYRTYFKGRLLARAFLGANALLRGAHFEIMVIEVKDKQQGLPCAQGD
ncbi:MAG TPA: RidA family protein, partial [Steroidobacteraceae bacterium]|nr:RidA family protein [Steroidobacteraceae bacterium]